jgi:hypothetical protein
MTKLFIPAALATALFAYLLLRPSSLPEAEERAGQEEQSYQAPPTLPLTDELRPQIEACLGEISSDLPLEEALLSRLQAPEPRLNWRVVQADDGRQEYRLRLASEPAPGGGERLHLQIFTVDAEGLPDLIPGEYDDPAAAMASFLEGKTVQSEIESLESRATDGGLLRLERENGKVVELEFRSPGGHLGCAGQPELSCKCL